jgi:hypothetical protein
VSRSSLGDVNSYLEGSSQYLVDHLRDIGYIQDKAFETYHFGQDIQVEVMVPVADRLSFCLGLGSVQIHKRQNGMSLQSSIASINTILDHAVRSIPITAAFDLSWPIAPRWSVHFETGAGLYFSRFRENGQGLFTSKTEGSVSTTTWEAEAHASGIGLFGGIGLEAELTRNLSLLVETGFRSARISGFSGQIRTSISEPGQPFDLFYYEFSVRGYRKAYGALNLPNAQRGYQLRVFREGAIDFSGWTLRAGLRISL